MKFNTYPTKTRGMELPYMVKIS